MTEKLYYESAYANAWTSKVMRAYEQDGSHYVVLDRTAFYPHGGGQPCDQGTIEGISVVDVVLDGDEVIHQVESVPTQEEVHCVLDWERRFDHMQQHSGQHLLSAVALQLLGAETLSFHLGEEYATIDLQLPTLSGEEMLKLEQEVNQQIMGNLEIVSYFVTEEQLRTLPVVKMPKVTESIRIVEMKGVEYNPCGGTHVSRTGELGLMKLLRAEKQKGHVRITFKCGTRALRDYQDSVHILDALAQRFNTGHGDIWDRVEKWDQETRAQKMKLDAAMERLAAYEADELVKSGEGGLLYQLYEDKSMQELQQLALKVTGLVDDVVLLGSMEEQKVVLAHSGVNELSCGGFFKEHLQSYQGRGGGQPKLAQAGFSTKEDLVSFCEFAKQAIRS
ncbi:alanyl-tRNA editing protein [Paenibacillus sp. 1001270B_150601_E10]|uniref:alanyl-tRNA editing protein n=1 Tax=Paenibacillus sp. 1001270B_150601_E10 TaxID=2787079 RepID=UPI00189EF178|nr:alanine--tRNA ligase-related protein [Paenibacillus sp. 1001270B_150601_E10]